MPVKQAPTKFEFDLMVVGMGFRLKRDVRQVLAQTAERRGVAVKLVREQENKYDLNAVKVIHADTGALAGKHLGYLSAETAAILAPLLDNGKNGGLKFKSAKLIDMDGELDHKQGTVHAVFDDFRK